MCSYQPILAIVTTDKGQIGGGGVPFFYCQNADEQQQVAFTLEKCLDAVVHEITPNTMIIVKHS